jgi:hypothetical protein
LIVATKLENRTKYKDNHSQEHVVLHAGGWMKGCGSVKINIIVVKSKEEIPGSNLAESSKEAYRSIRAVLPMMMW